MRGHYNLSRSVPIVSVLLAASLGCSSVPESPAAPPPWYPMADQHGNPLFAVFESRIPCADCEKIKFALALYRDKATNAPATYQLARVYVAGSPEGRIVVAGTWTITTGTKLDPNATVYRLDTRAPVEFRAFWAMGQDILFILDADTSPRVGTAGYGYALNRTR
jgi:NlpE N-terminal domain